MHLSSPCHHHYSLPIKISRALCPSYSALVSIHLVSSTTMTVNSAQNYIRLQLNKFKIRPVKDTIRCNETRQCCKLLGKTFRARSFGIFRNEKILRNIFRLFCSREQKSRNGNPGIPGNENSTQTNAYSHYSNYSYFGLIPNERALSRGYKQAH